MGAGNIVRPMSVAAKLINLGRLPHALILKGKRGSGKKEIALGIARSLLCIDRRSDGTFCGYCSSCRWFESDSHSDFITVTPENGSIKIDQIRAIISKTQYKVAKGGHRVFLIEDAETLRDEASNALLKVMEEPPEGNVFILTTSNFYGILPTIRSRCCSIALPPQAIEDLHGYALEYGLSQKEMATVLLFSEGNLEGLKDWIKGGKKKEWERLSSTVEALITMPYLELFSEISRWVESYDSFEELLKYLKIWLLSKVRNDVGEGKRGYPIDKFLELFEMLEEGEQRLKVNINRTIFLEEFAFQLREKLYEEDCGC